MVALVELNLLPGLFVKMSDTATTTETPKLESSEPSSVTSAPKSEPKPKRPRKEVEQKVKCSFCPRSFSTPRWNTNHCNQDHLDLIKASWLECKYCHLFLPTPNSLMNHVSHIHEPKKKVLKSVVKCQYCSKQCYPTNHLYKHCLRYHREKVESEWHRCDNCSKFFQSEVSLQRHRSRVHEGKAANADGQGNSKSRKRFTPPKCPFCPEVPANLNITIAKHCTDKHFDIVSKIWSLCDVCGQYVSPRQTKIHNRLHGSGKCQFCDFVYSYSTEYNYAFHANVNHPKEVSMLWAACPDCLVFFPDEDGVNRHRNSKHVVRREKTVRPLKFLEKWENKQCRYCGLKISQSSYFKLHLRTHFTHPSPDIIKCLECVSVFQTERSKARHFCQSRSMISCQFCDQTFLTEDGYERHARDVHNDQISLLWIGCKFCSDRFDSESKLSRHLCKKRIVCPFCSDKIWSLKGFLTHANEMHLDEVSTSWNFDCDSCHLRVPAKIHISYHRTVMDCAGNEPQERPEMGPPCLAMSKYRLNRMIRLRKIRRLPEGLEPRCTACDVMLPSPQSWTLHQNK